MTARLKQGRDDVPKRKTATPWFAGGIQFECQTCGMCCRGEPGYVWVTADEITRMAKHVGLPRDEFFAAFVRRVGPSLSLRERPDGDCVLWRDGCTVYVCRPSQCRTFPFWEDALASRRSFRQAVRGCPGVGHGKLYSYEDILRIAAGEQDT